jgi:hypothetical protein
MNRYINILNLKNFYFMKKLLLFILLIESLYSKGQNQPEENPLFNAFKQGNVAGGGNCASIALIKACIGTFGIGKVFTYTKSDSDSLIIVKLRTDSIIKVTFKEIKEATKENGFISKSQTLEAKKIRSYADTCFAVITKVNEILWEYDSYSESLSALLNGYNTPNIYRLLGVKFKEISTSDLKNNTNIVTYNSYHAVYSSYGFYDETKSLIGYSPNGSFNKNRFGIKCSWYGCKPKRAFVIQ